MLFFKKLHIALALTQSLLLIGPQLAHGDLGPLPEPNPAVGAPGSSSMHGDTASSDATMSPGPGSGPWDVSFTPMFGACSTVLIRQDGHPFVLCTSWFDRSPVVRILDRDSARPLAKLRLAAGSLLGGVYAYLDNQDRLVMVDGNHNLIRVKASKTKRLFRTVWKIEIEESVRLTDVVTDHCGGGGCDRVVSINPEGDGSVWFATQKSLVGIYQPATGAIESILLSDNETIHNSFSTTNDGRAAVATDHALYLLHKDELGAPTIGWRREYDRGLARHPGQLSHGTGATPTFFGPTDGTDFVTITDNGEQQLTLLIWDAGRQTPALNGNGGELVCAIGVFEPEAAGTENSAMGIGNTVIVASTYGYPYPQVPEGAGPAVPETAYFAGGMARIDVRDDRTGCDLIWQSPVRSAAVPKLSVSDDLIYTIERQNSAEAGWADAFDSYHFTAICPHSGTVLGQQEVGGSVFHNTLQMAGNVGHDGVYWQGTLGGVLRIAP